MTLYSSERHLFAVCVPHSVKHAVGDRCSIREGMTISRCLSVLRVRERDRLQLFHGADWIIIEVAHISRASIEGIVLEVGTSDVLAPTIDLYVGFLDRAAWSDVVRNATIMGVRAIVPVITQKSARAAYGPGELDRMHAVAVAAAEQSKQFRLPELRAPIPCADLLSVNVNVCVWYDGAGDNLFDQLSAHTVSSIAILCGPSGDFTNSEKEALASSVWRKATLGSTVLRTEDACFVGIGVLRALYAAKGC